MHSAAMSNNSVITKQVWKENFVKEFSFMWERAIIAGYKTVSLSTRLLLCQERIPATNAWGDSDANYSALAQTTDRFKNIVKVGFALCNRQGDLPRCWNTKRPCIWEFNLMPLEERAYSEREESFLEEFCGGVNSEQLRRQGIDLKVMFDLLINTCIVQNDSISWVTFKGGLDFMALLRFGLQNTPGVHLEREQFFRHLHTYFPVFYDMAAVLGFDPVADNGTIEVSARSLNVWREDMPPHGAASDSLLALRMFMEIKRRMYMKTLKPDCPLLEKKESILFGVTSEQEANATPTFKMAPF
ncbi:probable CCR4-associated factor 1 homolog 10 [Nymphaea colorata]|uniref:probable CCR4-associated factor 1 homolog 10 n=1 Tax=Nymphaea colorata TaxID=210225 RepID=UPI00129D8AD2|nr:probable CCR4-associated factor 1 homolog 10 [Nymphaea colorata]